MIRNILTKLLTSLKTTTLAHKKKLILILILIIGYRIALKKLKEDHIISIVLFFISVRAKILEILPVPAFCKYRSIKNFEFEEDMGIAQLQHVVNHKLLLERVKRKEVGALSQLKISIFSEVVLSIVLYNVNSIYELIRKKYFNDFQQLGASDQFESSLGMLRAQFLNDLQTFRLFIVIELDKELEEIKLNEVVNVKRIEEIFGTLVRKLEAKTINVKSKVLSRKTNLQDTREYKIADNYFKTTREYVPQKKSGLLVGMCKMVVSPLKIFAKGIHAILKIPQENVSGERYGFVESFYVLGLKKFGVNVEWPNNESKYLFGMVLDELINIFYSLNFNIINHKKMIFNLTVFVNRIKIYFNKENIQSKKIVQLLSVFFKIVKEEMVNTYCMKDFYRKQLTNANQSLKEESQIQTKNLTLQQYKLQNDKLKQIYLYNQMQHIQKQMQTKFYHERDGITFESMAKNQPFDGENDIQQLMKICNKANDEEQGTFQKIQMMKQLIQSK